MSINAVRVQIHLKEFFDENSSKEMYNFWYAFQPTKLTTIKDLLEDIRINYLQNQLSLFTEDNDQRSFMLHLEDGQLLPFTSSEILRDNDRLTLTPLTKYRLNRKSLENSVNLNLSSSITIESRPVVSENNHKRQRIESTEETIPLKSTIPEPVEEQPRTKKTKTKGIDQAIIQPPIKPVTLPPPPPSQEPVIERETISEAPLSFPSTNTRMRELKSKTPAWKAQKPAVKGDTEDKVHIRFDSDSDEELLSKTTPVIEEKEETVSLPHVNGSNSSVRIVYVPTPAPIEPIPNSEPSTNGVEKSTGTKSKKKTIDLLFEMKQHKTPEEKEAKKIQQQFGRKRAQHKKRALDYFSIASFVDQAFGLDKEELQKQFSSNGNHTPSSDPQTLPSSFNKLARLPLVAEVIDDNDKIYDLYPPATQCPPIQTRIAFKSLELSEDFCPKMSGFKEGTVINVNETTNELTIELDQAQTTVFNQPSKFYAPSDDQIDEQSTTIILPFSDLHSVRLLPSTST